ncbi:hypothetical protein [Nocardia terpenica]|uniref:hypothetical protein n=1 Tax=Nocardia terpenica TaxID=455432 RepID=UPI001581C2F8|nr:hypothetical protein [Nocardia terpenica]
MTTPASLRNLNLNLLLHLDALLTQRSVSRAAEHLGLLRFAPLTSGIADHAGLRVMGGVTTARRDGRDRR